MCVRFLTLKQWAIILAGMLIGALTIEIELIEPIFWKCTYTRKDAVKSQLEGFKTALDAFEVDMGRYPTRAEGLTVLVTSPIGSAASNWRGPYLDRVPIDPWGTPYRYLGGGKDHLIPGYITSAGPDGLFDTPDDLWNGMIWRPDHG